MAYNSFLSYNPDTGLIIKTKAEIFNDLIQILKSAYGDSYTIDEGTEIYTALDIISAGLTDVGNAAADVYNAFSYIYATGAPLDSLVSLAGIARKSGETDSQLRYRYATFLFSQSVGTMRGLEAQLLKLEVLQPTADNETELINPIQDVKIVENTDPLNSLSGLDIALGYINDSEYIIKPHSILVIIKFEPNYNGFFQQTQIVTDNKIINKTIEDYKSLGCGITKNVDIEDYYFAISNKHDLKISINLLFNTELNYTNYHSSVEYQIKQNIVNYVNNLSLGEDILYSGIMSCIYQAYNSLSQKDFIFSVANKSGSVDNSITVTVDTESAESLSQLSDKLVVPYTTYFTISDTDITVQSFWVGQP